MSSLSQHSVNTLWTLCRHPPTLPAAFADQIHANKFKETSVGDDLVTFDLCCTRHTNVLTKRHILVLKVQRPVQVTSSYFEGVWGLGLSCQSCTGPVWSGSPGWQTPDQYLSLCLCWSSEQFSVLVSVWIPTDQTSSLVSGFLFLAFFNRLFPPVVLLWFLLRIRTQEASCVNFCFRLEAGGSECVVKNLDQIPWNTLMNNVFGSKTVFKYLGIASCSILRLHQMVFVGWRIWFLTLLESITLRAAQVKLVIRPARQLSLFCLVVFTMTQNHPACLCVSVCERLSLFLFSSSFHRVPFTCPGIADDAVNTE